MTVSEIRITPHLPKLVEAGARNCYKSFDFAKPDSHQLVKRLMFMPKPHLSIGHHGNILVCISMPEDIKTKQIKDFQTSLPILLLTLNFGSHRYLTVSTKEDFADSKYEAVVSGNIVAWINAINHAKRMIEGTQSGRILQGIIDEFNRNPETQFFMDKEEGYAIMDNPYVKKHQEYIAGETKNRILVHDDFSDILTEAEREVHETATVVMNSSRDMLYQLNRHDAGISQLSQRYVLPFDFESKNFKEFLSELTQETYDSIPFKFHVPEGLDPNEPMSVFLDKEEGEISLDPRMLLWKNEMTYNDMMEVIKAFYFSIFFHMYPEKETKHKRANEIARSILTNNMDSVVYYTRAKWRWRHLFELRTEAHTQLEARRDAIPLLESFHDIKWFGEYEINRDKLIARERKEEQQNEE